jgi:sulfite reductase (NADPH) flavoprotein alpha-component
MTLLDTPIPTTVAPTRLALPVLPETAPFTPAQRAWLNGFLAGMLNTHPAGSSGGGGGGGGTSAPPDAGTSTDAGAAPDVDEDFPWHEPSIALDERLKLAEGKPVARLLMAAMAQLDCGACGYACKTYAEAIAEGREKDLTRCTPGGRDTSKALKQLLASAPAPAPAAKAARPQAAAKAAAAPAEPTGWTRDNPFAARLLRSARLNGPASSKDTRLVVLDVKGSGIAYKAGDALGVYPENCPDLVQDVIEALGATGAEDVGGWDGQPTSLREALLRDYTITRPSPVLIELLADRATDEAEKDALAELRDDDAGLAPGVQVLDLLRRFTSALPHVKPDDFVSALSPLAPRLYSISSSPLAHPDQVHLTVGAVRFTNDGGRVCKGVASTFLADRVRPGVKVRVFLHPSYKFGLCDGDRPIVMVGPGTGIAPFRAFLQERAATKAPGKSWLFFGDQKSDGDFLYRDELERYHLDGVLTRLDTAFSRDQAGKVYVQHRMLEHAAELWSWLEAGAAFYVCGDAQRMASDVDKALRQVIAAEGKLGAAEADRYVAEMVRAGRYQRDVY